MKGVNGARFQMPLEFWEHKLPLVSQDTLFQIRSWGEVQNQIDTIIRQ